MIERSLLRRTVVLQDNTLLLSEKLFDKLPVLSGSFFVNMIMSVFVKAYIENLAFCHMTFCETPSIASKFYTQLVCS